MLIVYLAKFKAFEAFSDPSSTYPYSLVFTRGSKKLGTLHGWYHTLIHTPLCFHTCCVLLPKAPPSPVLAPRFMLSHPKTRSNITSSMLIQPFPISSSRIKCFDFCAHTSCIPRLELLSQNYGIQVFLQEPRIFSRSDITSIHLASFCQ